MADRLGLKEQRIQQYETMNYASTRLARIKEVVGILGIYN